MAGIGLIFLRRSGQSHPTAGSDYILSETKGDAEVFRILMEKGVSSDGIGITKDDAARVTDIGQWFGGNTAIINFDEFQYFTSVRSIYGTTTSNGAFRGCENLVSISLPPNITSIGSSAFANCYALTSIGTTNNVVSVLGGAFENCTNLTQIMEFPNLSELKFSAFRLSGISKFIATNYTGTIANNTFEGCTNLIEVQMPSVSRIENTKAFYGCTALETIDISSVTYVGNTAFENCSNLATLNAPSLQTTGFSVFRGLTSLQWARFGTSLTSIGANGLENATSLQYMIFEATTPPTLAATTTINNTNNCPIYVPDASLAAYQSANIWKNVASRIKGISEYTG